MEIKEKRSCCCNAELRKYHQDIGTDNVYCMKCNKPCDTHILKPKKTFEEFLGEQHAKDYAGLDDDMQDDYEQWLANLDVEELIDFGNKAMESTPTREE